MKVKALMVALVLCMAAARLHGIGLGLQMNFGAGDLFSSGVALVLSPSDSMHIALNWHIAEEVNTFELAADYCPFTLPATGRGQASLNFTLGLGLFANIQFDKSNDRDHGIEGGVRAPIGFSLMMFDKVLELYFHVAPSFGLQFRPGLDLTNLFFPIALGGRFWFR